MFLWRLCILVEAELVPKDFIDLLGDMIAAWAFSFVGELATFGMLRLYLLVGLLPIELWIPGFPSEPFCEFGTTFLLVLLLTDYFVGVRASFLDEGLLSNIPPWVVYTLKGPSDMVVVYWYGG